MPFTNSNDYITGRKPIPTGTDSADTISVRYALTMATADLSLNVIGVVGVIPSGHIPVAMFVDSDALAASALVLSVGIGNAALKDATGATSADAANTLLSTTAADGGAALGTGLTVAVAGGQVNVVSKALSRVQSSAVDRKLVVKVTTAAVTPATGELGVTILYRPA